MKARRTLVLGALAFLLSAKSSYAYHEEIHFLLDERATDPALARAQVSAPSLADADSLRLAIWRVGSRHPDAAVRKKFLGRYSAIAAFDRWALKEFLGLNPDASVFGIDELPELTQPVTVGTLLSWGSRLPDDDKRNQSRFAHDEKRAIVLDRYGSPVPADPIQLTMSSLRGLSSQGYAHYGLPAIEFTDSPDVLKKEPRRFAYPPSARAYAPEFAQMHTDLALCVTALGSESAPALGWLFLGNAHHYIQDVANQIHTLQAIYDFFYDAKIESYKEELFSLGGLLRSREPFVSIGIGIIKNHHLIAENLFAKRVREILAGKKVVKTVGAAVAAIKVGDSQFEGRLRALKLTSDKAFAQTITRELIEVSSHEGGDVYKLVRGLIRPEFSKIGVTYVDGDNPDSALRSGFDADRLDQYYALQVKGFARAGSALRAHVALYSQALAGLDEASRQALLDRVATRLVATQIAWLDERDERVAVYDPQPPRIEAVNWWVPGGLVVVLGITVGAVLGVRRWRRKRALLDGERRFDEKQQHTLGQSRV